MTRRDGLTDFDDLPPTLQDQAMSFIASIDGFAPIDARLFAFRITKAGRVSTSRKDRDAGTAYEGRVSPIMIRRAA